MTWNGGTKKILNVDISTNVFVYMVATLAQVLFQRTYLYQVTSSFFSVM